MTFRSSCSIALSKEVTKLLSALVSTPVHAGDYEDAIARWSDSNIENYSYTLTQRVMWGATKIILIVVRNGELVSADHIIKRTNPVPDHPAAEDSGLRITIDELLEAIGERDDFLRASYNAELGYPVNIYYRNADWDEAEDQFEIRDFTVLSDVQ